MSMIRCFSVLILLCQQVTHNKTIYEGKPVIIVPDVNMTSKRAFLQKFYRNQRPKKWGLLE